MRGCGVVGGSEFDFHPCDIHGGMRPWGKVIDVVSTNNNMNSWEYDEKWLGKQVSTVLARVKFPIHTGWRRHIKRSFGANHSKRTLLSKQKLLRKRCSLEMKQVL
jgi:hypothetical protein